MEGNTGINIEFPNVMTKGMEEMDIMAHFCLEISFDFFFLAEEEWFLVDRGWEISSIYSINSIPPSTIYANLNMNKKMKKIKVLQILLLEVRE